MYYVHGSVWAIPTYRVYRLYDTSYLCIYNYCHYYPVRMRAKG